VGGLRFGLAHHRVEHFGHRRSSRNQFEDFLLRRQEYLGLLTLGDVEQRRPPMGNRTGFIVNREALKMDPRDGTSLVPKTHLAGLSRTCLQGILRMSV